MRCELDDQPMREEFEVCVCLFLCRAVPRVDWLHTRTQDALTGIVLGRSAGRYRSRGHEGALMVVI